jgi:CubicO group peptidase (beta-lactamase class C family)
LTKLTVYLLFSTAGFYVPATKVNRFAAAYTMGPGGSLIPVLRPRIDPFMSYGPPDMIMTGGGMVSTAKDYARFVQMLLNGGSLDGVRVLERESVDLMWRNQLDASLLPMDLNGWKSDPQTGWGLGFTVASDKPILSIDWSKHTGGARTGSISWGGGTMCNWLANADTNMLVIFMTQRVATPIPETFQQVIVDAMWKAIIGPPPIPIPGPMPGQAYTEVVEAPQPPTPKPRGRGSVWFPMSADGSADGSADEHLNDYRRLNRLRAYV